MAESKEIPGRTLDNQYNQKLTPGNYRVEMAANGSTPEVLYVEPYGHEGDNRREFRFGIEEVAPENVTASVEVACKDGRPRAVLKNPTAIPLAYSVGGETVTVDTGESRTVELAGGEEYTFDVRTTSGDPVELDLSASGAISVEGGDTVVADCGRETGKAMADATTDEAPSEDGASETDGSVPGFTALSAVLALLTVACLRYAAGKRD
jgi:PGF-CTERM protein